MRSIRTAAVTVGAALALGGTALAGGMHPELGAHLSGMGQHGFVNLTSKIAKKRLCWTFHVPTKGITSASIRDAHGMVVAHLGMHYSAKGCAAEKKAALDLIETRPGRFVVWVDTKGHPGELRGKLFAGMAHM